MGMDQTNGCFFLRQTVKDRMDVILRTDVLLKDEHLAVKRVKRKRRYECRSRVI